MASGATAIAYETVTDANGGLPLLAPMSEVAGRLAIEAAADCAAPSEPAGAACSWAASRRSPGQGGGARRRWSSAPHAARMAVRPRRRSFHHRPVAAAARVSSTSCSMAACARLPRPWTSIESEVLGADVVIGAVLVAERQRTEARHPRHAPRMKRGARCSSTCRSTRAAASRPRGRRRTPTRPSRSTAISAIAWRICRARCRSPRRRRLTRHPALRDQARQPRGLVAFDDDPHLAAGLNVRDGGSWP